MHSLIFFGTTESSLEMLKQLLEIKNLEVSFVVTKKGKPAGRNLAIEPSAIAKFCAEQKISYLEVEKVKDALEQLKQLSPDLFFVVDFGKILPQEVLDVPKHGIINFHPSLLPKYRGPSPIVAPILNGDSETGFSYMLLDAEMDHGPILYQEKVKITPDDTAGSLESRLFERGVEKLEYVLTEYLAGTLKPVEQDHSKKTVTRLIQKQDAQIDFATEPAELIERKVRAYNPSPFVFFFSKGKRIQIIKSKILPPPAPPPSQGGEKEGVFLQTKDGIVARCANETYLLLEIIKPEGKPARSSREFERYFSN